MTQPLKSHFICTEGGSNKEYEIHLIAEGEGFVLHTYHGARGKSLKLTVKTKEPVAYEVAKKAYDKAYNERLAKHYKLTDAAGDMSAPAARELLTTYVAALPLTYQVQQLDDFFLNAERLLVQHQGDPIKAVAHLQALIERTDAQRRAGQGETQEPKHG